MLCDFKNRGYGLYRKNQKYLKKLCKYSIMLNSNLFVKPPYATLE